MILNILKLKPMNIRTPLDPIQGKLTHGQRRAGRGMIPTRPNKDIGKVAYNLGDSANTIVMALPGTSIEALREKYLNNRLSLKFVDLPIVSKGKPKLD